jgi:hypothetical protein
VAAHGHHQVTRKHVQDGEAPQLLQQLLLPLLLGLLLRSAQTLLLLLRRPQPGDMPIPLCLLQLPICNPAIDVCISPNLPVTAMFCHVVSPGV